MQLNYTTDIRSHSFSNTPQSLSSHERMVINDKEVPFSGPSSVVETILTEPSGKDDMITFSEASSTTPPTAHAPTKMSVSVNAEQIGPLLFTDDSSVASSEGATPCPDSSCAIQLTDEQKALYMKPLLAGWRREVAVRKNQASANADVYFFAPDGTKLRSKLEIARYMLDKGIVADYTADQNFCFSRRELGGEFEPYEMVRLNRVGRHSKSDNKGGMPKHKTSSPTLKKSSCNTKNVETPSPADKASTQKNVHKRNVQMGTHKNVELYSPKKSPQMSSHINVETPSSVAETSSKKNDASETITSINEEKGKKKKKKKKERRYCICSGNYVGDMVSCNNAKCVIGWYHFDCVKVTERPKRAWYCPICRGVNSRTLLDTYAAEQNLI